MKRERIVKLLLAIVFAIQFAIFSLQIVAYAQAEKTDKEIKIGVLLPETGSASWVKAANTGIDLALKEINDAGGPLGRKIVLIRKGTDSTSATARPMMLDLVEKDKVAAVVGPTSSDMGKDIMDVLGIPEKSQVVVVSPTAGTTKLDGRTTKFIYRTTSSDIPMALAMALEVKILGLKKVSVLCANTGSGTSIADALKPGCEKVGIKILESIIFQEGKTSYREELEKLFKDKPDAIFFEAGPKESKILFKEWSEMKLGGVWIGTDYLNEKFVEEVAPVTNIEGLIGVRPSPAPSARLDKWKADLKALTGAEGVPAFSAQAYDAMNIIVLAIEAAGKADGDSIAAKMHYVANAPGGKVYNFSEGAAVLRKGEDIDYIGIAGKMEFNASNDVIVDHVVNTVKAGKLVQVGALTQDELAQYTK